jgi:hypothetical protein
LTCRHRVAAALAARLGADHTAGGDFAALEVGVREALGFDRLLGPYSRFRWSHPGPSLLYALAPFYALDGERIGGLSLGAATINLVAFASAIEVVRRWLGAASALWAAGLLGCFVLRFGVAQFRSPWNPTMTIGPTVLALVLAAAVLAGRSSWYPAFLAAGSFAVQAHVGTGVFVAILGLATTAAAIRDDRRTVSWWLVGIVVGVFWAPVAVEQVRGPDGNVAALAGFFTDGTAPQPTGAVLRAVVSVLDPASPTVGRSVGPDGPNVPARSPVPGQLAGMASLPIVVLGIAATASRRGRRDAGRAARGWAIATLLAMASLVISTRSVRGPLFLYVVAFGVGVGAVAWGGVALAAERWIRRRLTGRHRDIWSAATVVVGVLGPLLATSSALGVRAFGAEVADQDGDRIAQAVEAIAGCERAAGPSPAVRVVVADDTAFGVVPAVVNSLERNGCRVHVDEEWAHVFSDRHRPTGSEDLAVYITLRIPIARLPATARPLEETRRAAVWTGPVPLPTG